MSKTSIFRDELQRTGIGNIDRITCGYFDCSKFEGLPLSPTRVSTRFEIDYYLADGLSTTVDGVEYPIKEDHILIAKSGQHRFSQLPFRTMYLKFLATGTLADKLNIAPIYFPAVNIQRIRDLFTEVILLYDNEDKVLVFHSKILELLHLILSDSLLSDTSTSINISVAAAAKKFINDNYMNAISLKDIADAVSLSPNHFHTVFKATCRMTPREYLINRRISAAKEMLWDTDKVIPEIAEKCGFGCQQYFTQIFKKQTGITPGKYRKQLQQNYLL